MKKKNELSVNFNTAKYKNYNIKSPKSYTTN